MRRKIGSVSFLTPMAVLLGVLLAACGAGSPTETLENNKEVVSGLYAEVMGQGNLAVADQVLAENYVDHRLPFPDLPPNRDGLKETVSRVRDAFPDIKPVIQDFVAEGDKVTVRVTANGTHQNEFNGIPPTGRQISWQELHIYRLADGQIVEHWGEFDMLGMLIQLGVVQLPGS